MDKGAETFLIPNNRYRGMKMKARKPEPKTSSVRAKFAAVRRELSDALIERDEEIDLALTALLAGEHLLLVGPPGTAKSMLLDSLMRWMDCSRFTVLMNRFTVPEEVLGPVSLSGLKSDVYRRVTAGKLPEAELAFLDEVFKASSAILNVLLKILNERTFDNGGELMPVPLLLCVSASNEWPQPESAKELSALFDRYLIRKEVRPIRSPEGRDCLLWRDRHVPEMTDRLSKDELFLARREVLSVTWTPEAREAMNRILAELSREGVRPGDRRQYKAVHVAKAYAYLEGAERVEPDHLSVLRHVLWDDPEGQPKTVSEVILKVANPSGMRVNALLLEAEQIVEAADVRDLGAVATAASKLAEVEKQIAALPKDDRSAKAREYVRDQIRRLKLASIESI